MEIRSAREGALPAIRRLLGQLSRDMTALEPTIFSPQEELDSKPWEMLAGGEAAVFVATDGDEILGLAQGAVMSSPSDGMFLPRRFFMIYDLVVAEDRRGRGLGALLVDACVEWARSHGFDQIALTTPSSNIDGMRFYERLGFSTQVVRMVRDI